MSLTAPASEQELEPHQKSMLQACADGRLADLQQLFKDFDVHEGDTTISQQNVSANGPPETISMFVVAIDHNQLQMLGYLLSVYHGIDLNHPDIARAIVRTNNLEMLKLVVKQSPGICILEFHYWSSFLIELCRNGPRASLLVHHLLDSGGDAEAGGHGQFSSLGVAMANGMPVEVLQKMLAHGAVYNFSMIKYAIDLERLDAVRLMLNLWRGQLNTDQEKELREASDKCNHKSIVNLVNDFIYKRKVGVDTKTRSSLGQLFQRIVQAKASPSSTSRETEKEPASSDDDIGKGGGGANFRS